MTVVYKYEVDVNDDVTVWMPKDAQIIHVGTTGIGARIILWALVDLNAGKEPRRFYVRGTGHPVPEGVKHIGTAIASADTRLVWHVFE